MGYKILSQCIGCGGKSFVPVIDLGTQYVVDFLPSASHYRMSAPLVLHRCSGCNLVQLKHQVTPDRLYKKFWYRSSINESMREALREIARYGLLASSCKGGEHILDIGCNDGQLLKTYRKGLFTTVGIDPCEALVNEARKYVTVAIPDYFHKEAVKEWAPYKLITAIAMFYDVDNPVKFLEDCRDVLDPDGVLIIQMNYLRTMLTENAFDNISHEHLAYYSMGTLNALVKKAGLECQGAQMNAVNGGSMRVFITHPGKNLAGLSFMKQTALHADLYGMMRDETMMAMDTDDPYVAFAARQKQISQTLSKFITAKCHESEIMVYGASTRGTALLQTLDIPSDAIDYAADRDINKLGKFMVVNGIEIKDEEWCRQRANYFLVLPWGFMETIKRREEPWMYNGGKLLVPLPNPYLMSFDDKEIVTPLLEYGIPFPQMEVL